MQRHKHGRQRSRKTLNKRSKKGKTLMRRGGKNEKKSLKKIKMVGGGKREDLMKQKQELIERYSRVKAEYDKRRDQDEQDDSTSMLLRYIQRDIAKIDLELKPQEEQAAILAQKSAESVAFKTQQQAEQAQRDKEKEERKSKEESEQKRLRQVRMRELSSHEKERVNDWKRENLSKLQDKKFVQSELDKLRTQREADTGHAQPRGATPSDHIWYELMVELLRSHGGV
jgi:hypothetical protein